MNKAGTTIGQVQCRSGQFGHQLGLKPAFFVSFSTGGNRRKNKPRGFSNFPFTPGPCLHMRSRVMNHKSATLVIQDLLKPAKGAPGYTFSKSKVFPCPHEPQFVMLKGLSLPNAVRGKVECPVHPVFLYPHISPGDFL